MLERQVKITGIKAFDESLLIALSLITICTLGPLKLDLTEGLPITLEALLVVWFSIAFGLRIGLTAVVLYLVAGVMGFGFFTGEASGWGHFIRSNGGFLLAFPVGAFVAGSLSRWAFSLPLFTKAKFISSALILLLSQLLILVWQAALSWKTISLMDVVRVFMPGLLITTAIGTLTLVFLSRALTRIKS